jgi:radical SAM protein (TIGR01212 family)
MRHRYNDLNSYFRSLFGCRVQKITIDAGLTCPNRDGTLSTRGCLYCNARGSGSGAFKSGLSITEQLLQGKKILARRYKAKKFIAYFQSFSNTYASPELLKGLYDEALSVEDIVGLAIGTRPDCVNEPVLDLLQGYTSDHLIWVEYGLQTANDETLEFINRGHDVRCFKDAVKKSLNRGIKICVHVILGLPHESKKDMMNTAHTIANLGIDGIKLHLLYVIKGTYLETYYQQGRFKCLEQDEYVDLICDFIERIPSDIIIQRLTGDPHPQELVAPQWALRKSETLAKIKQTLANRNSTQGIKYF